MLDAQKKVGELKLHELSFGKIVILRKDIAEVIINEDVEMDIEIVDQFHDFLLSHMSIPFSVVVNKINSYTYDFEAQMKLGTLKELKAIAVIAYTKLSKVTTESMIALPRDIKWNTKIFSNRDGALAWIMYEN